MSLQKCAWVFLLLIAPLGAAPKDGGKAGKMAKDCSNFGIELYFALPKDTANNIVFSPYSIFSCMSMVYTGARGDTATEMQKALHLSLKSSDLASAANSLSKALTTSGENAYKFSMANGLWLDQDTFVLTDFRHALEDSYQAKVQSLDFSKPELATSIINEWTYNQTQHKIANLLQAGDVDSSTRLVLTNALYFKGNWVKPFDPENTEERPFHVDENSTVQVPMMEQTSTFPYFETESCQILGMPFNKGDSTSAIGCLFLLPKSETILHDCEALLTTANLQNWLTSLDAKNVTVALPKFCVDQRYDLNQILKEMGIKTAFTDQADFSGIDGMRDLSLSRVVHEAYFSLDEAGVTAAAATGAAINVTAVPPTTPPLFFNANRPFFFALIDLKTKLPLFFGKIQDPSISECAK